LFIYVYIDLHEKFFSEHVEIINGSFFSFFFVPITICRVFLLMKINDPKQKKLNNLDDTEMFVHQSSVIFRGYYGLVSSL